MRTLLFTAVAGICGTGIGGLLSAVLYNKSSSDNLIVCWMLSFAAGIMTSIVCFGLVPEAVELAGMGASLSGLLFGVLVIMALNRSVDKITGAKNNSMAVHHTHEELYHESSVIKSKSREKMLRSGTVMIAAIGLHNIPEGLAIGAGDSHNASFGALLALMITLHNIPEGSAIAAPLLAGGIRKWRVVLLTSLSGAPTLLGGIAGMLIGGISSFAVAISLSAAGGAMLYVVFGEIIPQSVVMTENRIAPLITLAGMIVGLLITRM